MHIQLVATSNATPRPAYYDKRTSFNRLRLSSTRVLGHGLSNAAPKSNAPDHDDVGKSRRRNRRHILVTGGFGSLGQHVVRDLLLGPTNPVSNGAGEPGGAGEGGEEGILITLLDVVDRTAQLNYLLELVPVSKIAAVIKGTDPRASAFTKKEHSVESFVQGGQLRVVIGDVRNQELVASLLADTPSRLRQRTRSSALDNPKQRRPRPDIIDTLPPVTGIIHLAAYSPEECGHNPIDCSEVELVGMESILAALQGRVRDVADQVEEAVNRPYLVLGRRIARKKKVGVHYQSARSSWLTQSSFILRAMWTSI